MQIKHALNAIPRLRTVENAIILLYVRHALQHQPSILLEYAKIAQINCLDALLVQIFRCA
jgi:hypothetical protein